MAATTFKWNKKANNGVYYVHAQLGDDYNGTGSAQKPFRSLYKAILSTHHTSISIIVAGLFSEALPLSLKTGVTIQGDAFGAAIFDGGRTTGMGGAVHDHAGMVGDDEHGYFINQCQLVNFIYVRSCVPVEDIGIGTGTAGNLGAGSIFVDSYLWHGATTGQGCAVIYPKLNTSQNGGAIRINSLQTNDESYTNQTFVGVRHFVAIRSGSCNYNVYDDCDIQVVRDRSYEIIYNHCVFRNVRFVIPANLSNDNVEHSITSNEIAVIVESDPSIDSTTYLNTWIAQYKSSNSTHLAAVFSVCGILKNNAPLFNNLCCVWRDATTGDIVSAENSANAYIDPELSSFDISIADNSPAVAYLSEYNINWHGAPATLYKMGSATDLRVNESATGDMQLQGNLKFMTDTDGRKYITWAKDFNDSTLTDTFKGGVITTRPRKIPSSLVFKYPMLSGQWSNCCMAEKDRNSALFGRRIRLTDTTVQFDSDSPLPLTETSNGEPIATDRLWIKQTPNNNELTAGYRYLVISGFVLLYNSDMSYFEYGAGSIIVTDDDNVHFFKRLYDSGEHNVQVVEMVEMLPNNTLDYDCANRIEIRLFNSSADANRYNTDSSLLDVGWIPLQIFADLLTGIHYYDLPQNDFVFSDEHGYLISQNPNSDLKTFNSLAYNEQHINERYDYYKGDDITLFPQGGFVKKNNSQRERFLFSPLNNNDVYVQLRMKIIPFAYV